MGATLPNNFYQGWYIAVVGACLVAICSSAGFEGVNGQYCASRSDGCCNGRIDECSFRVFDTLCYCDEFCNRTRTDDCCPDYWTHCLNIEPPSPPEPTTGCYVDGHYYDYGQEVKKNCNKCLCKVRGGRQELVCEHNECLLEEAVITDVNSHREQLGWVAANYSAFWGRTLSDGITYRTGTLQPNQSVKRMIPVKIKDPQPLPLSFDSRQKWHELIGEPVDQGWCGSSWAVSTVAVASDRFAIMSSGLERVKLSTQHLLSCNKRGQQGCQGGHLSRGWMYIRKFGLVNDECYPSVEGRDDTCRLPRKTTLQTARCKLLPGQPFRTETYKVGPAYRIKGEHDVMHEIMASGPVQATMKVYQDFFAYKTGIYKKSMAGATFTYGYHSVRILGWGEEINLLGLKVKYWLAANSWGPHWGENGLFRIVRGSNECEIEDFILAAWSKVQTPESVTASLPNNESNSIF